MFVSFDEAFKPKPKEKQNQIPEVILEYLNSQLESSSLKYISDKNGHCVITSIDGKYNISGIGIEITPEMKSILGNHISIEDIQEYSYNSQRKIPIKMQEDGYIVLNGEKIRIDKLNFDPFCEVEYVSGMMAMIPKKMDEHISITMGGMEEEIRMSFTRVPDNSLDWIVFESEKDKSIRFVLKFNKREMKIRFNVTYDLKKAKCTKDMIITADIYNAFASGKGKINGISLIVNDNQEAEKTFSKEEIIFWKKVMSLEELLKVQFNAFSQDITNRDIYIVEVLYRSLIAKTPVRIRESIVSVKGTADMEGDGNISHNPMAFHFQDHTEANVFNQTIELFGLKTMYNCVIEKIQKENGQFELMLGDESEEKRKYTVALYFLTEEELLEYVQDHDAIGDFHDAKTVAEYYSVL